VNKKWGLWLMLAAVVAAPMLACGFPLPAGTEMMRVSKAVCAQDEATDTCQERQDAYQLMGKLQSAVIPDFESHLEGVSAGETLQMSGEGSYEYKVSTSSEGLGADLRVTLTDGEMVTAGSLPQSLAGMQMVIIADTVYGSVDDGETWSEMTLDQATGAVFGLLLGLGGPVGAGLDLYSDPGVFSVTVGDDVVYDGQTMHVQTLTIDPTTLVSNTDALTALLNDLFSASSALGLDMAAASGMTPEQFAPLAPLLLPYLEGTELSTTLYIGADDGYIHYVEENLALKMDMSATDPTQSPITATYTLKGHITQHNEALTIEAPANATPSTASPFGGGLFKQPK
jgi:hypothetical protein